MRSSGDKKKKGKKIIAGNSLGILASNNANNQVISSESWQKGDYKIPRKPRPAVPPSNNLITKTKDNKKQSNNTNIHNNIKSRANTKGTTNMKAKTHTNSQNAKKRVLSRLHKNVDIKAVRKALDSESELPDKVKAVFCDKSVELNERGEFVISKEEYIQHHYKAMLEKTHLRGWLEWMQGKRGWIIDTDKNPFVRYFRELHEVYSVKVRALLKEVNEDTKSVLRLLYYKDPFTLEKGHNGTKQSTNQQTLWKKADQTESLDAAVAKIRPFLEVIKYFCIDPREKWETLPWLTSALTPGQCRVRIDRVTTLVKTLMRSSDWGPDAPVHWAAHPPRNSYPLAVITSDIMTELVVGIANILSLLFLEIQISMVKNLNDVDKLLDSPLWSGDSVATTTKKGSPKNSNNSNNNKKKPAASKNVKKKATQRNHRGPSVDDIVIDLTGLSIDD